MPSTYHPSLKKLPLNCRLWLEHANSKGRLNELIQTLTDFLNVKGIFNAKAGIELGWLGTYYGMAACDAFVRSQIKDFSNFLHCSISFNALLLRWDGVYSELRQDLGNWPQQYWDSLKAAGPIMLSDWNEAKICAVRFIEMAEKDQRVNTVRGSRRIKQGTNDVFLIYLFSQAFDLKTSFTPPKPLIPEYQHVLDCWRTTNESAFKQAMQAAADFHISRSKDHTTLKMYEFTWTFDRIFPVELLAVQALRRRDGLPAFDTGHALIDTPWSVIKDLPDAEPHPLAVAIEARLKNDYPTFR
jgi:hypothetical protein